MLQEIIMKDQVNQVISSFKTKRQEHRPSPVVITLHLVEEDTAFPRGGCGDKVFVQQSQDV